MIGYDPEAGSKRACIVDAAVAYGQNFFLLINQAIEMKGSIITFFPPYNVARMVL